jgi:radical SAM superfamily enzyme with C-terminal helix-hairpin-helix motif
MAVSEIAQLLEADVDQVVKILVQKKIVGERRESHRTGHQMLNGVSPRGFQLRRISVRRSVGESFELLPFRHSGREWATFA